MKLSIIVTHYKEPKETISKLFESIKLQRGVDFSEIEVLVVNDGKEVLPDIDKECLPNCKVTLHPLDKCGVSACRNYGIDHAEGEYIMFCDCDDCFSSIYGLRLVIASAAECYDAIVSPFVEEHCDNGVFSIVRRENECTFIHGKAYRRQYLLDNGLRFKEALTVHEDGFFNSLALMCTASVKTVSTPFYAWCYRDDSVTDRTDRDFLLKTYPQFIDMRDSVCDELDKRKMQSKLEEYVSVTLLDAYYAITGGGFTKDANKDIKAIAENRVAAFYRKWKYIFNKTKMETILSMQPGARANAELIRIPRTSFGEFLKRCGR